MKQVTNFSTLSSLFRVVGSSLPVLCGLCLSVGPLTVLAATAPPATPVVVPIDQTPLTVQPQVAPNLMLMLDDSGSMNWDVMPDWSYLPAPNWANLQNNWNEFDNNSVLPLIYPGINGVYYNPTVTYLPPPLANGTANYPVSSFSAAPVNGFDSSSPTVDLSQYRGRYDSNDTRYAQGASSVQYSIPVAITGAGAGTYSATSCPSWTQGTSTKYPGYCYSDNKPSASKFFSFYDTSNDDFYVAKCSNPGDVYNRSTNNCSKGISFFTYATANSSGGLVRNYVAENTGDCAAAGLTSATCVPASDTSGVAAPAGIAAGTNIANWFTYYHTRILAAKSGLMAGFAGLPAGYRLGFGSINDSNTGALPNKISIGSNWLAPVQLFGTGTDGLQKAQFWNWVAALTPPPQSTPLRDALQSVGKYYQTSQPWKSMQGDPGYTASGTNAPLACRESYTILTTDGFWNGPDPNGIGRAADRPGPNLGQFSYQPVSPFSDSGVATSCSGVGGSTSSSKCPPTLADVATYYWENDLQPTINNEVPGGSGNPDDPATWQHMTTFTMGLGFDPVGIQPAGTTTDQIFNWARNGNSAAITGFSWPTPSSNSVYNVADLAHAAVNGHGAFFSVKTPESFESGIKTAIGNMEARTGTGASLAANSTELNTGTVIYQASYRSVKWSGDLLALAVDPSNGSVTGTNWSAAGNMPVVASRTIQTYNPATGKFWPFDAADVTNLSSAQQSALGYDPSNTTAANNLVNYLRGDKTNEQSSTNPGGAFRGRSTVLGDIVDSQPVYAGAPNVNEFANQSFPGNVVDPATGTVPFDDWAEGATSRTSTVWVAANDGMLHGFDASTGKELYAYLPGAVITAGVAGIANPDYGTGTDPHQYFNDGQLTIADAYFDESGGSNPSWHTILVGTTGRGTAKAIYALDITNPSAITPLWERSAGDHRDGPTDGSDYIGQMTGKPIIAQTSATGTTSTWSVLMGNGYNSNVGVSALLQFDLATGNLSVHPTTDAATGNGLAAPVVWMNNPSTGVNNVAYAGDLDGNVWAFGLSDPTGAIPTPTSTGVLVFTAKDGTNSTGKAQPITAGMTAGKNPKTGDTWLFFGTGRYLASTDLTGGSPQTQTWYGIIVQSANSALVTGLSQGRANLVQRSITAETVGGPIGPNNQPNPLPSRTVSAGSAGDMAGESGWYLDLLSPGNSVSTGERMVDVSQLKGSVLVGTTRSPVINDPCEPSGSGWIMALDAFTGTAPSNNFFDVNGDHTVDVGDELNGSVVVGVQFNAMPNSPIFVTNVMEVSLENSTIQSVATSTLEGTSDRVDWRELTNQ